MDVNVDEKYKPPPEFVKDTKEPLIDINMSDSTELWLLQLPFTQELMGDIDGQELQLKLHHDGKLATFHGSSGKEYHLFGLTNDEPGATVFASSEQNTKIVGKISRRVSVVHYPDPKELEHLNLASRRQAFQSSAGASMTKSSRYFPTKSSKPITMQSGQAASTRGSGRKSSLSEVGELSKSKKRHHASESNMSTDYTQASRPGHSAATSSVSSERCSNGGKSKKKIGSSE